ncbi:unnamed protein product [Adineta steineri]|uniref:Uncharacterized protein n=1 Tax=Adineta steineri TaxID=433720 RepID=A0A815R6I6_9BILA|nr:unnamed protein product [Adineta steineri]CAF4017226.1 unnamed protein product [Adineta steineri]
MLSWLFFITTSLFILNSVQSDSNYNQGKASYFSAGQLHLISSSVTAQSKQDVLYSLLLAQLAANAKVTRTSISAWYENYEHVLPNIAWVTSSSKSFTPFVPTTDHISLKSVITTSLAGQINPELQDILNRAFDKIQHLNPTDRIIDEFTKDAGDGNVYNLQVQSVNEVNGDLTVLQLYITLTTTERAESDIFLLHEYAKDKVQIQVAYETNTLNSGLYQTIRQSIIDKLGPERIARYISMIFDDGSKN